MQTRRASPGRLVPSINDCVATRFTDRPVSAATHDLVQGCLGPITRGIRELVATLCWKARRRAPSALTRLRMPGSIDASTRASPNAWLFPPSFLRRRLVGFGPDPTKVTVHSLASPRSFLRRRLLGFVPDPTNGTVHSLAPPRSFLRRRLVGLGQSRDQTSTPLAGERQCVRVGACGRRARPSELLGGLLRPLEEHRPPRAQSTSAPPGPLAL